MNIFKALSEGNGKISETNMTSFLSYLLDSSNELNNAFFILLINLIDEIHECSSKLSSILNLDDEKTLRGKISLFSSLYRVSSEPESVVFNSFNQKQIPDILLRITLKSSEEEVAYIIIENKISKGVAKKGQLEKQYEFFKDSSDYAQGKPVFSILISPNDLLFKELVEKSKKINKDSVWLTWSCENDEKNSVEIILQNLIQLEQNAKIRPIDLNTQFIIKSFIDYLSTEFSAKTHGKKNYSVHGFDEVSSSTIVIDSTKYIIKRFSNNMIRLFNDNDELLKIEVKPILRKIIEEHRLDIELFHSSGTAKNTQILGRELINELNN